MLEGAAPKRVVISQWKSMDDAKKFYSSEVVKKALENEKISRLVDALLS